MYVCMYEVQVEISTSRLVLERSLQVALQEKDPIKCGFSNILETCPLQVEIDHLLVKEAGGGGVSHRVGGRRDGEGGGEGGGGGCFTTEEEAGGGRSEWAAALAAKTDLRDLENDMLRFAYQVCVHVHTHTHSHIHTHTRICIHTCHMHKVLNV